MALLTEQQVHAAAMTIRARWRDIVRGKYQCGRPDWVIWLQPQPDGEWIAAKCMPPGKDPFARDQITVEDIFLRSWGEVPPPRLVVSTLPQR